MSLVFLCALSWIQSEGEFINRIDFYTQQLAYYKQEYTSIKCNIDKLADDNLNPLPGFTLDHEPLYHLQGRLVDETNSAIPEAEVLSPFLRQLSICHEYKTLFATYHIYIWSECHREYDLQLQQNLPFDASPVCLQYKTLFDMFDYTYVEKELHVATPTDFMDTLIRQSVIWTTVKAVFDQSDALSSLFTFEDAIDIYSMILKKK